MNHRIKKAAKYNKNRKLLFTSLFCMGINICYGSTINNDTGFLTNTLPPNDDMSTSAVPLNFDANFFGTTYNQTYVNNNGNITFGAAMYEYTPFALATTFPTGVTSIIAPFFSDVDTRYSSSSPVTYGNGTINGQTAFGVNYLNVSEFGSDGLNKNNFQVILIARPDTGIGNFDIQFNYGQIQWDHGGAGAGFSNGSGDANSYYELTGSRVSGAFIDGGPNALINSTNIDMLGRFVFSVRNGRVIVVPISNIDTAAPFYSASNLDISVNPAFEGGTLKIDNPSTYTQNFTINGQGGIIDANGVASTFSGVFSNLDTDTAGNLTIVDNATGGVITLTGLNTYTGLTAINNGTLALAESGSIASSSGIDLTSPTSVFDISNVTSHATQIQDLSGVSGSKVILGSTTLTAGTTNNTTFAGTLVGDGGVTKTGTGVMTLTGLNGYTGLTAINNGTLALAESGSIASSSGVDLTSPTSVFDVSNVTSHATQIQDLSGVSGSKVILGGTTLTAGTANNTTFAGTLVGDGGVTKTGTGVMTLTGLNGYTGLTAINNGTLALAESGSIASSSGIDLTSPTSVFDVSNVTSHATQIKDLSGVTGSQVILGGTTLTAGTANNTTFAGTLVGNGGLDKMGSGTLNITGSSLGFLGANNITEGVLNVTGYLDGTSLNIANQAMLTGNGTVGGTTTVQSGGIISPSGSSAANLTLNGNYVGNSGSALNLKTTLAGDNSSTDSLTITGNSSGNTQINVSNTGGTGSQTSNGIRVVQVDGTSDAHFTLNGEHLTAGSYEYRLVKNGINTPTDGDWYLRSTLRPAIVNYVTAQTANSEAAYTSMSSLHQRLGEQKNLTPQTSQTWGRIFASSQSNDGKKHLGYEQMVSGFQFGRDIISIDNESTGLKQRAGITAQYSYSQVDTNDRSRLNVGIDTSTGTINSTSIGMGAYYTNVLKNGAYLDLVGQVNHINNKFTDNYSGKSKQNGWQAGLSVEVGKPVAAVKGWQFEPQAQLSYLHNRYNGFADTLSRVDGFNSDSLRARVGLRVHKDVGAAQYYAIANVTHDFLKPQTLTLHDQVGTGAASVNERFDKTAFEVGAGISGQVGKTTSIYADARYEQSFAGHRSGAKFNMGVKTSF